MVSHLKVICNFVQHDSELYFEAWWRFKDLLCKFPHHGLRKDFQLRIFINGLRDPTREWVERSHGINPFYHRSINKIYWVLEDMAEYDHWCWMNSNTLDETQPQQEELSPELFALFPLLTQNSETKKHFIQEMNMLLERMDVVNNTHIQKLEYLNSSIEAMIRTIVEKNTEDSNMYESHYEEEKVEVLQEESPCEEGYKT